MKILGAVLAAGKGERMRIATPKPLLPLLGRPMVGWAYEALRASGIPDPIIITSPALRPAFAGILGRPVRTVVQPEPRGTGDAVSRLKGLVKGDCVIVVIQADTPLFDPAHITALLAARASRNALVAFATATVEDPSGLGRVLRDPAGAVANIVEETEASPAVKRVREINAGLYAFAAPAIFDLLAAIAPVGEKKERYLTRAVELALSRGASVTTVTVPADASAGVNTLPQAAYAQAILQARKLAELMSQGVIVDDPASVTVEWGVEVGAGSRLRPGTCLEGATKVGTDCVLGPDAVLRDAVLGARVTVRSSYVTASRLDDGVDVGPYAHIRPGCRVRAGAEVRSHAEIVRADLGEGVKMHHFSYVGDAVVGAGANIGAGAITANYDGKWKLPSRIGKQAFIGSGSVLVAPARVGDRARVGAGAVVPAGRAVKPGTTVVGVPAKPLKGGRRA
ncbi:MAG: NTP transferase domain-containing protein [Candidatus Coatesbacteria bacterium]